MIRMPRLERFRRFQLFLEKHKLTDRYNAKGLQELRAGLERATKRKYRAFWVMICLYILLFSSVITTIISSISFFQGIGEALTSISSLFGSGILALLIYCTHRVMVMYDIDQSFYISAIISRLMKK